jgi:arsenite transporter
MTTVETLSAPAAAPAGRVKRLNPFERYLSLWVALCMVAAVALGRGAPGLIERLRGLELGNQINGPIAVLIWLMIVPMMMRIDFAALAGVGRRPRGLLVTLLRVDAVAAGPVRGRDARGR